MLDGLSKAKISAIINTNCYWRTSLLFNPNLKSPIVRYLFQLTFSFPLHELSVPAKENYSLLSASISSWFLVAYSLCSHEPENYLSFSNTNLWSLHLQQAVAYSPWGEKISLLLTLYSYDRIWIWTFVFSKLPTAVLHTNWALHPFSGKLGGKEGGFVGTLCIISGAHRGLVWRLNTKTKLAHKLPVVNKHHLFWLNIDIIETMNDYM